MTIGTLFLAASLRTADHIPGLRALGGMNVLAGTWDLDKGYPDSYVAYCSSPIIESRNVDIIEELTRLPDCTHAKTVIVSDNFEARTTSLSACGRIGAIFRYRTEMLTVLHNRG
ncbi:MAG: hypothetical protein LUO93_04250 [Methanomicrobiales archaeon]|nr:hypothetical protein [Methanomicrobiales archaeon]